ncbi:MAG: hypothetical protein R3C09_12150 [Pirellulaceae bacterium]
MLSIVNFGYLNRLRRYALTLLFSAMACGDSSPAMAQGRYATSDSHSGYVHWIELLDANNTKVDPTAEFPQPYSPERTCGRCHEFDTISHGWHFNAADPSAESGRPGQPWIWSDPRSGTHLPLSYRGWEGTYHPDVLGLSRWEVAAKLGGFMPGGGVGSSQNVARRSAVGTETDSVARRSAVGTELNDAGGADAAERDRSAITGATPIDCLLCHNNQGSGYSPFVWTEQIESQNFAYAPTVALGLAEVNGSMARLKNFDPTAADAASKLPKLTYNTNRFRSDGKVFIDLVRKPQNNACNYCHTNVPANSLTGSRWLHDEDVHVRAGMMCADCHRNGLDHHTVRGFEGERHVAGSLIASLSCQGCHLGSETGTADPLARAGRMGAPKPAHRGLPPLHFEKLSCTACHSGPQLEQQVSRQVNSIIHRLGEHVKRTGQEFPAILGPVNLPRDYQLVEEDRLASENAASDTHGKYTPHRLFWPSFWGTLSDGKVEPLNPEVAYDLVRKPLKVRKEFTEELREVSLSLAQRKELLGEARARVKDDERTPKEREKVQEAEEIVREAQIEERMQAALLAIEEEFRGKQAVYVTAGTGWVRDGDSKLKVLSSEELGLAAESYAWPLAHNVRPARQALGAEGCTQCHSDEADFFFAELKPVSLVPDQDVFPVEVHELQQADMARLKNWNQLFAGRSSFKIASLIALAATCLITLSVLAWNIGTYWQRKS